MHSSFRRVSLIGAEIGEGASDDGCRWGARALRIQGLAQYLRAEGIDAEWSAMVRTRPTEATGRMASVERFSGDLAQAVTHAIESGERPVVVGGDHSCAVGTWSAVAQACRPAGDLGLIWIDAHLDAHTPDTSESQAPHGMPVAALLGHGPSGLTHLYGWGGKLKPRNLVIIGARSYEAGEQALLERLGVRVMYMPEVHRRGFAACFAEAVAQVRRDTVDWGLSFDLDALDPADAPGTGTPVDAGIALDDALAALHGCARDPSCAAIEVAEYNPARDVDGITGRAVCELLAAFIATNERPARRAGVGELDRALAA